MERLIVRRPGVSWSPAYLVLVQFWRPHSMGPILTKGFSLQPLAHNCAYTSYISRDTQTNTYTRYITTIWIHLISTLHIQSYTVLMDAFKKAICTSNIILVLLGITNHNRKGTQMINWSTMEVSHQFSLLSLISNGSSSSSRPTIFFTHFSNTWVTHKPNQEKAKLLILDF